MSLLDRFHSYCSCLSAVFILGWGKKKKHTWALKSNVEATVDGTIILFFIKNH